LSIADFGLAFAGKSRLAIGNRKSKIRRPTRYRVVVLTSSPPNGDDSDKNLKLHQSFGLSFLTLSRTEA